jgi:hypothetical protein
MVSGYVSAALILAAVLVLLLGIFPDTALNAALSAVLS